MKFTYIVSENIDTTEKISDFDLDLPQGKNIFPH